MSVCGLKKGQRKRRRLTDNRKISFFLGSLVLICVKVKIYCKNSRKHFHFHKSRFKKIKEIQKKKLYKNRILVLDTTKIIILFQGWYEICHWSDERTCFECETIQIDKPSNGHNKWLSLILSEPRTNGSYYIKWWWKTHWKIANPFVCLIFVVATAQRCTSITITITAPNLNFRIKYSLQCWNEEVADSSRVKMQRTTSNGIVDVLWCELVTIFRH